MQRKFPKLIIFTVTFLAFCASHFAQDVTREMGLRGGGNIEVVNRYGRVSAKSNGPVGDEPTISGTMKATSDKGVLESDIKYSASGGRILIVVDPKDSKKRIDITLTLPERVALKVETTSPDILTADE